MPRLHRSAMLPKAESNEAAGQYRRIGSKPSPPSAPPNASAAPIGATQTSATPSTPCAFCGHPPGNEPAILGRGSHKRRKGLSPRADPCVASIDAVDLPGATLRAGLEPWGFSLRSRRLSQSSVPWFEALPVRALTRSRQRRLWAPPQPPPRPRPLAPFAAILRATSQQSSAEVATKGARGFLRERSRAWRLWTPRTC